MGDCYSVELRMKVAKGTKSNLAALVHRWMKAVEPGTDTSPGVRWSWSLHRSHGARPDTLKGVVKILLAAHQNNFSCAPDEADPSFDLYRSGFDASYGWGAVMRDAFREMAWALADGSYLWIHRDSGVDDMEIRNGEIWQRTGRNEREIPCAFDLTSATKAGKGRRSRSAAR